jgi:type I restriction enzyme S subunit
MTEWPRNDTPLKKMHPVGEASGSASEVGKPAIWDESIPDCCFQNTLLRLRSEQLLPKYLYFVILALARSGAFARASKGVGIHHLSRAGLANVMIEVPPLTEQHEIVARIVEQQQQYDALLSAISTGLQRAARLRASILATAFSGHLVPQDPADQPASALLEGIAAMRVSSNGKGARRTSKQRVSREEITA